MKLTCQQKSFLEALLIVQKAINPQNTLPILGNVLLKAEGQKLYLTATNLEIAIVTNISAEIKNEGKITVPAKILGNYMSLLKEGEVEMNLEDGQTLTVKSKGSKTKIKGLSPDEFPSIPTVEKEESFEVEAEKMKTAIEEVVFCCATTSTRPVLSGMYLWGKENTIRLVATDSYRLGERILSLGKKLETEIKNIVPARTMQELSRILGVVKEKEQTMQVICSKNQILFKTGNIELTSRLIDGKFPEYAPIIPKTHKTKVVVETAELMLGIKRVALFARENNNNIQFFFADGKTKVTTDATEIGSEESEIEAEITGPNSEVALNGQYILEVLQSVTTPKIVLQTEEKLSPIVLRPEKDENLTHVIMPLKI